MAYMSQEKKKAIAVDLKKEFGTDAKKRGFCYSLGVYNHSTIVMRIPKGSIDFIGNYMQNANVSSNIREQWENEPLTYLDVNVYCISNHFSGKALEVLEKAMQCLNKGNHDNSDAMTDYFDVGWYVTIHIGQWDKPYILQK